MLEIMMPGYFTENQCKALKEKLEKTKLFTIS